MRQIKENERLIGAPCDNDCGAVPNLGGLASAEILTPAAKDRLLGWQIAQALERHDIGAAAKEAAQVTDMPKK